jgi:hypothetical protein
MCVCVYVCVEKFSQSVGGTTRAGAARAGANAIRVDRVADERERRGIDRHLTRRRAARRRRTGASGHDFAIDRIYHATTKTRM